MGERLRISVTLSGGAALGAYQSGAMAAMAVAVQQLQARHGDRVAVDAVGGASAGALVALFTAHSLLAGIDPVWLLNEAWVERVSLELLAGRGSRAPLSFDRLRERVGELVDPRADDGRPAHRVAEPQRTSVAMHVALTGLQGLNYRTGGPDRSEPLTATTYVDWGDRVLEPGGGAAQLLEPRGCSLLDFTLASAANAGAFAPMLLDRRGDAEKFRRRGITNFPDSGHLWYTDGGTVQDRPLGRVLEGARRHSPGDVRRLHLLVVPRSEGPSGADRWADPEQAPTWTSALARTLAIIPAQALYDDLRRLEKVNARLGWARALTDAVAPHLDGAAADGLREVLGRIAADRAALRSDDASSDEPGPGEPGDDPGGMDAPQLLRRVVDEIAGLGGKAPVAAGVISPLLLADEEGGGPVPDMLAGEFLGDFGGFLSKPLRRSDFALGYDSMLAWLPEGLRDAGLDDHDVDPAVAGVRDRRLHRWRDVNMGSTSARGLSVRSQLGLGRLLARVVRVLTGDALRSLRGR
ncbi:hypothetical protein BH20ACT9_BH20ACT9_08910 [soil metagenome]